MLDGLRSCRAKMRALSWGQKALVGAVLALVTLWGGSKDGAWTNGAARRVRLKRTSNFPCAHLESVTTNDIARGWRIVSETAGNALAPMPAGAVTNESLRRRGGFDWAFRVEPEGWRFPYAGGVLTGVTVLARGEVRPNARTPFFPVPLTNGVSLLPMAQWNFTGGEPSVFVHAVTPSNSLLLAWWNALAGRNAHCPTNLQMELFADGAFVWRTMDRATAYAPVFAFDWDGDGLANEVDPEPSVVNPVDAHGTNAEWYRIVCSNVFESVDGVAADDGASAPVPGVRFRSDVTARAYYFVDVVASEGPAPIVFAADRESRLGSPVVVAQGGVTNRVPLLVGVRYEASSPSPLEFSVPEHVVVEQSDPRNAIVQLPLTFSAREGFSGSERIFSMDVQPVDPGGTFSWGRTAGQGAQLLSAASGSSCGCWSGMGNTVTFGCGHNAGCHGGCEATGSYVLESASFAVTGGVCRCGFDDPPNDDNLPPSEISVAPGVSVSFSHSAVIFEETYQEYQGVWKPKRSTRVRLTVSAYGGPNGGTLAFTCRNLEKLAPIACGPLALPASMVLAAGETYNVSFLCEGLEASAGEEDIVVRGTFTENLADAAPQQSEAALSVVRVEVRVEKDAPGNACANRHAYGIDEFVSCLQSPRSPQVEWTTSGNGTITNLPPVRFHCPIAAEKSLLSARIGNTTYNSPIKVLEPTGIECSRIGFLSADLMTGAGMALELRVVPLEVSFEGLRLQEVAAPSDATSPEWGIHTGYFNDSGYQGRWYHYALWGAGTWISVLGGNIWGAYDQSRMMTWAQPWSSGILTWVIPIAWKSKTSPGRTEDGRLARTYQSRWTMTEDSLVKTKYGQELTVTTNGQIFLNGELCGKKDSDEDTAE